MGENTVMLNISPNRENIRFSVIKTTKTDQLGYLGWLIDIIKERNLLSPKTIIFCATMHDVAKVFGFLLAELGDSAYVAEKPRIPENRLVGIYHSMTLPKYKSRVSHSFKDNVGQVRIVIATSALSMGVNFPDVRYVIHIGPARSVADHIQEAGRAGRDGASAHNVVLYHGNQLAHYEEDIKQFARSGSCVRKALFKDFDDVPSNNPPHECCSSCGNNCVCSGEECSRERFPFDEPKGMTSTSESCAAFQRPVSEENAETLQKALCEVKCGLGNRKAFMFDSTSSSSFTSELVNELVLHASSVFSLSDILKRFPVFSLGHAKLILEIFQEIFEDIPYFDEMMATVVPNDLFFIDLYYDCDETEHISSESDSNPDRLNTEELENV